VPAGFSNTLEFGEKIAGQHGLVRCTQSSARLEEYPIITGKSPPLVGQ
jgi:hypothetical protein